MGRQKLKTGKIIMNESMPNSRDHTYSWIWSKSTPYTLKNANSNEGKMYLPPVNDANTSIIYNNSQRMKNYSPTQQAWTNKNYSTTRQQCHGTGCQCWKQYLSSYQTQGYLTNNKTEYESRNMKYWQGQNLSGMSSYTGCEI